MSTANPVAISQEEPTSPCPTVIQADHVTVTFSPDSKSQVEAVCDISLDIRRGEKLVILGPSGCGKSTFLNALAGFVRPTSGTIYLAGEPIRRPSMKAIMVFQDYSQLMPWRTVMQNVDFGIQRHWPRMPRKDRRERALHYVDLVGLAGQRNQFPGTLSGGQKQRCALARGLAVSPEVLLMDEPFAALDAITRERMQEELERLWCTDRPTIVFVTHDIREAVFIGNRIMIMSAGPGRTHAILDNEFSGNPNAMGSVALMAELKEMLNPRLASTI